MLKTDAPMRPACGMLSSVAGRDLAVSPEPRNGQVTPDLARCTRQMRMVNSTTAMHKHSGPAERALDLHQGTPRAVSDADPRW